MNLPSPRSTRPSNPRAVVRSVSAGNAARDPVRTTPPSAASGTSLRLLPSDVDFLRQRLHGQRPQFGDPAVEQFVQQVFASDELVEAYFFPKVLGSGSSGPGTHQQPQVLIPFEVASRAARRAEQMALVQPFERRLTYLATLLYPCGLFHCAHPALQQATGLTDLDRARVRGVSHFLLEHALRKLRCHHLELAETLSAVLGFGDDGHCNAEQVGRIATAVYLPNLRVTELWNPAAIPEGHR